MQLFGNLSDNSLCLETGCEAIRCFMAVNIIISTLKPLDIQAVFDKYGPDAFWVRKSGNRFRPVHRMRALAFVEAFLLYFSNTVTDWELFSDQIICIWIQSYLDPLHSKDRGNALFRRTFERLDTLTNKLEFVYRYRKNSSGNFMKGMYPND